MTLLLISGSGAGAGKTTLARRLVSSTAHVISLAQGIRWELGMKESKAGVDWFDTTQAGKSRVIPAGSFAGMTVREALVLHGELRRKTAPTYWIDRVVQSLRLMEATIPGKVYAVDDVRKVLELTVLREEFPDLTHLHLDYPGATPEPEWDNEDLGRMADYRVTRRQ